MKEKVLNQSIFLYTYPSCGETFCLNYPILYHQMEDLIMIYLVSESEVAKTYDLFDDEAGVEGFYIVSKSVSFYLYARLCAGYSRSIIRQKSNFPIKEQKGKTALPFLTRYNSTSSHSFFVI